MMTRSDKVDMVRLRKARTRVSVGAGSRGFLDRNYPVSRFSFQQGLPLPAGFPPPVLVPPAGRLTGFGAGFPPIPARAVFLVIPTVGDFAVLGRAVLVIGFFFAVDFVTMFSTPIAVIVQAGTRRPPQYLIGVRAL